LKVQVQCKHISGFTVNLPNHVEPQQLC